MDLWPHQEQAIAEVWQAHLQGERKLCVTSPTGGGKSVIIKELIMRARYAGQRVALYTNRVMLTEQISGVLDAFQVSHGVRAAGYQPKLMRGVQVCSLMTEHARTVKAEAWVPHDAKLVIVDEIHAQRASTATNIFSRHVADGATLVGFTATPIGISHLCDRLIVAGTNSQLRSCGAHLPCVTYGPDEPNMQGAARSNTTGEYSHKTISERLNLKKIFGRVLEWYQRINPEQKPALLFAPGVSESKWFVDRFQEAGIAAAHIDGDDIYDHGHTYDSSPEGRRELLDASRSGAIKVLCNRFVLREGIDAPWIYHCIMATPFGSLTSYLQAGGRLLRSYPGYTSKLLQDHGGNWHRHGSLNEDRVWDLQDGTPVKANKRQEKLRRKRQLPPPVRCPQCGAITRGMSACPQCGSLITGRWTEVIETDGQLRRMEQEDYRKSAKKRKQSAEQKLWWNCYYACLHARKPFNMRQVAQYYRDRCGSWPPQGLSGMPHKGSAEWEWKVHDYHYSRPRYQRSKK